MANLRAMKDKKRISSTNKNSSKKVEKLSEKKVEQVNWGSKARVIVQKDNGFSGDH